mgnify:CR=1 FL=1
MKKNIARLRRAKTTRSHIRDLGVARLSVLRSGQHIYAQVFTADGFLRTGRRFSFIIGHPWLLRPGLITRAQIEAEAAAMRDYISMA